MSHWQCGCCSSKTSKMSNLLWGKRVVDNANNPLGQIPTLLKCTGFAWHACHRVKIHCFWLNKIPKSLEKHGIVDNISPNFLETIRSDSNTIKTIDSANSFQFDSQNLDVDVKKCIKSLVIRQKLTNECIDIDNVRARTPKFDSKKESKLTYKLQISKK